MILSQISNAQEKKYLYSGGMLLLQPGYAMTSNPSQNINSLGFGIGGILRFYLKKHLTLGIIGGSQKTGYQSSGSNNSYISLGYGGPFIGYTYLKNRFRFCASISIGKGRLKNLHIENQTGSVINTASYYNYAAWVAYPMISADYLLTEKIVLTSQVSYLTAQYNKIELFYCPVFQFGVLFNR
jgi:hypothetical protein